MFVQPYQSTPNSSTHLQEQTGIYMYRFLQQYTLIPPKLSAAALRVQCRSLSTTPECNAMQENSFGNCGQCHMAVWQGNVSDILNTCICMQKKHFVVEKSCSLTKPECAYICTYCICARLRATMLHNSCQNSAAVQLRKNYALQVGIRIYLVAERVSKQ